MSAPFEFNLSFPLESRYLDMLRDVVSSVARQAGCGDAVAAQFAEQVEATAKTAPLDERNHVPVVVRQTDGLTEVRLGIGEDPPRLSVRA